MFAKVLVSSLFILLLTPSISNAKSCKKYKSCYEVISDYPDGYFGRKDRDKDGIPCENVCHSKKQVQKLLNKIKNSKKR